MICPLLTALVYTQPLHQIETVRQLSYEHSDHRVRLRRLHGSSALFFQSKMSCDVDGSPNAYHPLDDSLSLDVIGSAGGRRRNNLPAGPLEVQPQPNVVVYQNGVPYIQPDGEFKGFYLSETSYENPRLPPTSPLRYLDARQTQFIVLPDGLVPESEVGDLAIVYDPISHRHVAAVFGDIGPSTESGEASLATIRRLGLPVTDGKSSPGQTRDDLFFLVFPHTEELLAKAEEWPHSQATIDRLAEAEFIKWGGPDQVEAVLRQDPLGGSIPDSPENQPIFDELAALQVDRLVLPYEFSLPPRYSLEMGGRLPCAPEIVATCDDAIATARRKIGQVERKLADFGTLALWPRHLARLAAILVRFPVETLDEVGPPENQRTRIQALLDRIQDLAPRNGTK